MILLIYVDSNIFIYLLAYFRDSEEYEKAMKAIESLIQRNTPYYTSSLTWDEVTHFIRKRAGRQAAHAQGEKMLRLPKLVFLPVAHNTIFKANEFLPVLDPRDAIHAACALENDCTHILANDADFDKIKGLKRIRI